MDRLGAVYVILSCDKAALMPSLLTNIYVARDSTAEVMYVDVLIRIMSTMVNVGFNQR